MDKNPVKPVLDVSEIQEIEITTRSKVRQLTFGEHRSIFKSTSGFDFEGIRDWQPGDPQKRIDWAHSSIKGFNPLSVREFIDLKSINIVIAADASLSTHCGMHNVTIGKIIAWAIATIGFSAAMFQDKVGLVIFGGESDFVQGPKGGRRHIYHLLQAYSSILPGKNLEPKKIVEQIVSVIRKRSLLIVISDFLSEDSDKLLTSLLEIKGNHEIIIMMVDSSFAFDVPEISSGFAEYADVETGESVRDSDLDKIKAYLKQHQDGIVAKAQGMGFEIMKLSSKLNDLGEALANFFLARKLKK